MAWMNQERKAKIAARLKAIPALDGWKYSLKVSNHSGITMTIRQADMDLLAGYRSTLPGQKPVTSVQVNCYHYANNFEGAALNVMTAVLDALNLVGDSDANYDNSDSMSDYYDKGWYVYVNIGEWDDPFLDVVPAKDRPISQQVKANQLKKFAAVKKTGGYKTLVAQYLPADFKYLSPGKKAAATKRAMQLAGV